MEKSEKAHMRRAEYHILLRLEVNGGIFSFTAVTPLLQGGTVVLQQWNEMLHRVLCILFYFIGLLTNTNWSMLLTFLTF